jgi:hypothetical protein
MAYTLAGAVPIGGGLAWLKSLGGNTPALPTEFVECNGQTLSDAQSIYNGQVMPNLNSGTKRFVRGSSTSGTAGGADSHTHATGAQASNGGYVQDPCFYNPVCPTYPMLSANNIPPYYEVVYVVRVK